jgi:mRNA interferase MazF
VIRPGNVVWVEFDPVSGREHGGRRAAVVVSSTEHLAAATTLVTVVPATTRDRGWPNHVVLQGGTGLTVATLAMTEQVRTIARDRIAEPAGQVDDECLAEIYSWIHRWLVSL